VLCFCRQNRLRVGPSTSLPDKSGQAFLGQFQIV
jgi:hypothetical protein